MKTIQRRPTSSKLDWAPHLSPRIQQIYASRGIVEPNLLEKGLDQLLPYHSLSQIHEAVALLAEAILADKKILIVGDFDADGATSVALCLWALKAMGVQSIDYLVPNRFEFGYGLTPEIVELASQQAPYLIMTVDNGISSHAGIELAHAKGIKVLVTDHHLPGETLPLAEVILNPNQPGDLFPSKNLAGVGVAFYLMIALRAHLKAINWFVLQSIHSPSMAQFLDIVALGTVADVVPMDRNNRILVHQGLQRIRAGLAHPGIYALIEIAKRDYRRLSTGDLGFSIGPRLNAAGRLDDMSVGIQCLLAQDEDRALILARQLNSLNEERREIEAEMQTQALAQLKCLDTLTLGAEQGGICLYHAEWHQGVIGILASRVKDKLHRPTIVFAKGARGELKGSARSIPGIHIRDSLQRMDAMYPGLILKFGGHAMAAGLTIAELELKRFQEVFSTLIQEQLTPELAEPVLYSDGELAEEELDLGLATLLRDLEPWGQGFPEPLFDGVFELLDQRLVGGKHLKLCLRHPSGNKVIEAIAFNVDLNTWPDYHCRWVQLGYRLDVNEFNGRRQLQLMVENMVAVEHSKEKLYHELQTL